MNLDDVKNYLRQKYDLKEVDDESSSFSSVSFKRTNVIHTKLGKWMSEHPERTAEILQNIMDVCGYNFHTYFSDEDAYEEFCEMRQSNPDMFYSILRNEELFLNTCLKASGDYRTIIHFDVDSFNDDNVQ